MPEPLTISGNVDDWIAWHGRLKTSYGLDDANRIFLHAFHVASRKSLAGFFWKTFNSRFRSYAKANGFFDGLWSDSIPELPARLLGAVADFFRVTVETVEKTSETVSSVTSSVASILKYGVPIVLVAAAGVALWYGFRFLKKLT